ncbi:MAG: DoxX family protein [Bacteroidetes bacterium]|nr:DoxX family protein [Bacteroidota bacterium]
MQLKRILYWVVRMVPAIIMFQTLYFKFTGQPESIYIFETVHMEPWGRYGSGVTELIAAILLLVPGKSHFGAVLGAGVMSGALFFHLTSLGIDVQGDGGTLFTLALATFICCLIVMYQERNTLLRFIPGSGKS